MQVNIQELASGDCEAELRPRRAKPRVTAYRNYNGGIKTHVNFPWYPHNSVFCIGKKENILDLLKEKMLEAYPDQIDKVVTHYHKGASDASQK